MTIDSGLFVAQTPPDDHVLDGSFSKPPQGPNGYGYQILATSTECPTASSTKYPALEETEDQLQIGNTTICHDCGMSCAQLLSG